MNLYYNSSKSLVYYKFGCAIKCKGQNIDNRNYNFGDTDKVVLQSLLQVSHNIVNSIWLYPLHLHIITFQTML